MTAIYNTATVCPFEEQNCAENAKNRLTLDPEIAERFAKSRNFHELQYLWAEWHEHSGKLMRNDYEVYVNLMNKMATGNNFSNAADYWKDDFEVDNFEEIIDNLWQTVKPLYDDLHTYMRYKLISIYGNSLFIAYAYKLIHIHILYNFNACIYQTKIKQVHIICTCCTYPFTCFTEFRSHIFVTK